MARSLTSSNVAISASRIDRELQNERVSERTGTARQVSTRGVLCKLDEVVEHCLADGSFVKFSSWSGEGQSRKDSDEEGGEQHDSSTRGSQRSRWLKVDEVVRFYR